MLKFFYTLILFFAVLHKSDAQVAIKTNLLYGATALTPNLGMEIGLGKRSTFELGGGYNPWKMKGDAESNKKLAHWLGQVEYRYWLCQRFNGHFFGAHLLGLQYNISNHKLPMLFGSDSQNYRFEGWGAGVGVSYGYQWILGRRWNLEATIGVGYARLMYDKYECKTCGNKIGTETRNYLGPTKAGVSLIYLF